MSPKTEGSLAIAASILVLFTAMMDPRVSVVVSVLAMLSFGIWSLAVRK
jgi:hypothetical protein